MATIIFQDTLAGKTLTVYPAESYPYGSTQQRLLSRSVCAKYIMVTGDNRGRVPQWVVRILDDHKLSYKQIGRTTNRSTTFALYEVT